MRIHFVFWIALGLLGISRVGSMLDAFAQYYQVRSLQTAIEASPPLRHQNHAPQDDLQEKMARHFKDGIEGGIETFFFRDWCVLLHRFEAGLCLSQLYCRQAMTEWR